MSLRITQGILYSRALQDIRNATSGRLLVQEQIATGRRVVRPSDDPAATLRILPLRATIQELSRMGENGALAKDALNSGASAVEEALSLMARLREVTTQAANGSVSPDDRVSLASEVDQMMRQLLTMANSRVGERFLFGGTSAAGSPFELIEDAGGARVQYRGTRERLDVEVAPDVRVPINSVGDQIFLGRRRGATVFNGGTGAAPSGAADSGVGFGRLSVTHGQLVLAGSPAWVTGAAGTTALGNRTLTFTATPPTLSIDGGPVQAVNVGSTQEFETPDGGVLALTFTGPVVAGTIGAVSTARMSTDGGSSFIEVSDFSPGREVQVRNTFDQTVTNVAVEGLIRTGAEEIEYQGTFDPFTVMIAVRDAMRNGDGRALQDVTHRLTNLLDDIDAANEFVLEGVRDLGSRSQQMDFLGNRVERLQGLREETLSQIEDADYAESILALQQQDFTYQAALRVSSRIVQTSLMDFLR